MNMKTNKQVNDYMTVSQLAQTLDLPRGCIYAREHNATFPQPILNEEGYKMYRLSEVKRYFEHNPRRSNSKQRKKFAGNLYLTAKEFAQFKLNKGSKKAGAYIRERCLSFPEVNLRFENQKLKDEIASLKQALIEAQNRSIFSVIGERFNRLCAKFAQVLDVEHHLKKDNV